MGSKKRQKTSRDRDSMRPLLRLSVLLATGIALVHCGGVEAPRPMKPGPLSFVVISIDTTRADHLGCYGDRAARTSNLDEWARQGVVFEQAITPVPITLPAHTTILTGLLPNRHGVRDNGLHRLPESIPTLAEILSRQGYDTRAIVGSAVLDRQYGLDRGFRAYDDRVQNAGLLAIPERTAAAVTDAALASASTLRRPFLLFVHYFDPHATYQAPPPFSREFPDRPYDAEIAYVDHELGRLRSGLESLGLLDHAAIAILSDHGESLGEHGEATHGVFLYQSTLHVPLILVAPGRLPAGKRIGTLVGLTDLAPTVLDLAGVPAPAGIDGRSLLPLVDAGADRNAERWLLLESDFGYNAYGWAPMRGMIDGAIKWIGAPTPEVYDLAADPGERRNLAPSRASETTRLRESWHARYTEDRRADPPGSESPHEQSERLEKLGSLGYVAAPGRTRRTSQDLPDPKDVIGTLDRINEARAVLSAGRPDDAASILRSILKTAPENLSALVLLGSACLSAGRPDQAVAPLRRAALLSPHKGDVHYNLGLALMGTGDLKGAEAAWRQALAVSPRYLEAVANLVDLLEGSGRSNEAAQVLESARGSQLESPILDYLAGRLAMERGDRATAQKELMRALSGPLPPQIARDAQARLAKVASTR